MLDLLGIDIEYFSELTDNLPVYLWVHDKNNTIIYGNSHFMKSYPGCLKQSCYQCIMGEQQPCSCCQSGKAFASNRPQRCEFCKRNGSGYDIKTFHTPITNKYNDRFILTSSFHINESEVATDNFLAQKQKESSETIFLVMCSACNKIKDKENNWISMDNYILDYLNVRISHGICPECTKILYPDLNIPNTNKNQTK